MKPLRHIYTGEDGAKFLRSEPATALCGFVATGQGYPSPEWCEECRKLAGLTEKTEQW